MTTQTTQATFKEGDTVLCPHWGKDSYIVQNADTTGTKLEICELASTTDEVNFFRFNTNGKNITYLTSQSVFHNTPANRQAIATLYHGEPSPQVTHTVTPQVKQINLARPDDTEVIIMGAFDVSNLACDLSGIADTLHDISQLLSMIYREDITHAQAKVMARVSQSTVETWENSSHENINRLNVALKQSAFGEVNV